MPWATIVTATAAVMPVTMVRAPSTARPGWLCLNKLPDKLLAGSFVGNRVNGWSWFLHPH
jgi:hypothetical protein